MSTLSETQDNQSTANHPLAARMGIVAGLSHNMLIGTIFGAFSVLIASIEERMHVSPEEAALGIPLVVVVSSLLSPVVGVAVTKYSLRIMLFFGALLAALAFLLLALTNSYVIYLVAYAFLLGPSIAIGGAIGPATLVTRWFSTNRGLALGLVHLPIVVAIMPVLSNWVLENHGAQITYLMLAALVGVVLLPATLLTVDTPPENEQENKQNSQTDTHNNINVDASMGVGTLLKNIRFWKLALSASALTTGSVILGTIMIPMAISWGIDRTNAAILASVMSLVGIIGSVAFGWVADRLGGLRGLALLAINCALLWAALLIHPSFPVLLIIIGLIGMHGAGMIPNVSRAISDVFGAASFSRGFGLVTIVSLPFTVIGVIGSQAAYSSTGSYSGAIITMIVFYSIATVLALLARD